MIESLQVIVTTRLGRNYYALYDPYVCIFSCSKLDQTKIDLHITSSVQLSLNLALFMASKFIVGTTN